jgi:hypothetical protein
MPGMFAYLSATLVARKGSGVATFRTSIPSIDIPATPRTYNVDITVDYFSWSSCLQPGTLPSFVAPNLSFFWEAQPQSITVRMPVVLYPPEPSK